MADRKFILDQQFQELYNSRKCAPTRDGLPGVSKKSIFPRNRSLNGQS